MIGALVLATALAVAPSALDGEAILLRAKAAFRAHTRPPYVSYVLDRRDRAGGVPDLENSYTLKIWCRTADRDALVRRVWGGAAYGALVNVTIAFDRAVDPGPPTADIFEPATFGAPRAAAPPPEPSAAPLIGTVTAVHDYDYRVVDTRRDGEAWHLRLAPRRDPERNRIDDLWVDASTFAIRRARVRDRLYLGLSGGTLPDEFDVRFTQRDGLPLIAAIHGETPGAAFETEYTFRDVTFPPSLPDWYFMPQTYGRHVADAPS